MVRTYDNVDAAGGKNPGPDHDGEQPLRAPSQATIQFMYAAQQIMSSIVTPDCQPECGTMAAAAGNRPRAQPGLPHPVLKA